MGFMDKVAKLCKRFGNKLKTEKNFAKMFYIAVAAVVVLLIVVVAVSCGRSEDAAEEDTQQEVVAEQQTSQVEEPETDYTVPDVALEENAYADVNALINQYFNAMTNGDSATITSLRDSVAQEELIKIEKESAYIDEFDSITVFTKPGPMTGSYVAFVYYEIKFTNINTHAPGLTTLYICPKEDGSLYICDANMTEQDTEYIKSIVAQTDVTDLFAMVETKYAEAVDADADLNAFMSTLATTLEAEVSEAMAQAQGSQEPAQETQESQETLQPESQVKEEMVTATDTVNVRASDSENADRIGRVSMGETVKRLEAKANGWSRVEYQGAEGYIKSEYLASNETQQEETTQPEAQQPEEELQEEEPQEEEQDNAQTTDITAKGTVTIKEAVNIRKSASTSSDKLGMAYQGETFELIMEQADGWCKIKYKGEVGYVKTEFVE